MFEELTARVAALAEERRRRRRGMVAAALRGSAARGVDEEVEEGVMLSGRGLLLRSISDPALRWIGARLA